MSVEIPHPRRGLLVGFATVLLFGLTVILQAFLVRDGIAPAAAVGVRYLLAGLVCLGIVRLTGRSLVPVAGEWRAAVLLGAIVYGLQAVLFYAALGHGSVASVSLLFYTYPVLVLGASLVLRQATWTWVAGSSAALSACGAAAVVGSGREVSIDGAGIAMALSSAACVAVFLLANQRLIPQTPALVSAAWVSLGVALSTLLVAAARNELQLYSARSWLILLAAGAATGLGTAGMYRTLVALGPPSTSVLLSLQTVVAIGGSALLLGQPVLLGQVAGGVAILAAIALAAWSRRARHAVPEPSS